MIQTFRHRGLEEFFKTGSVRGVDPALATRLRARLGALHAAVSPLSLDLPGYNLHQLKGDRAGTWSIRITSNWRITFRFEEEDAYDVNLEDYH